MGTGQQSLPVFQASNKDPTPIQPGKMASSGSPLLRHLFNSLVKRVTEVKKEEKEYNESTTRDRSYSVTSTDSGYYEGSPLQGCAFLIGVTENNLKRTKTDPDTNLPLVSLDEVSEHCSQEDGWMVLYDRVYDVTAFLREHPGGEDVMIEYLGYDATFAFRGVGHSEDALEMLEEFLIGILPFQERLHISH